MGEESEAEVSAAAVRTMRGSALVKLIYRMSVPEFDASSSLSGSVDFEADRCRLDGDSDAGELSMILDGSTSYSLLQPEGRWTFTRGAPGARGMFHPSGLLDALIHAQTTAISSSARTIEVGLSHR